MTTVFGKLYFLKFSWNILVSFLAVLSYSRLLDQVFLGFNISAGTPGQLLGIFKLKNGSLTYSTKSKSPFKAALIMARVYFNGIRCPLP